MNVTWARVWLCASLIGSGVWAHAQPSRTGDERVIEEGERAWGAAYASGDTHTVERLLADDFRGIGPDGTAYDKAQALREVRRTHHITSDTVGAVTLRFFGDAAIAQARESTVGPAPEFKAREIVFTDTWVRRAGRWRIVAAEDLDPGAPTLPRYAVDQAAILQLRAASNRAIAAHDMAAFTPMFADDAVFVWSNGTTAVGRSALVDRFASDFADPAFVTYVRTPSRVAISDQGVRAVEHGTWTAIKREARGETRYGGDYAAHWFRTADGWRVRGELYVKLRCTGPLCQP